MDTTKTEQTTKLTMVTINGKTIFANLPVGTDGKARYDLYKAMDVLNIPRGGCVWLG